MRSCGSGWRGGDADGCSWEGVVQCVPGLFRHVWGASPRRDRQVPPPSDTGLRGHGAQVLGAPCQGGLVVGCKVPFSGLARVHPSTDRLGVAGAAQDTGRGLLSPGE